MKEEFPGWFGKQIRQCHVDNDLGVNESNELFALACGPSQTPISVNSCVVNGVRFVVHNRDERRTTQNSGICSPGPDGEMYYDQLEQILKFSYLSFKTVLFQVKWFDTSNKGQDDPDVIHVDNSSDLALSTSLNDLEIAALHIDGQSINFDAPPDIIDVVDEDDDIIDEEDPIPHDLADSDDKDLINLDINDGVNVMSADVAWGHGGDGGGDDRPPPYQTQFDLRPHMESDRWPQIYAGIQQHLQKIYNGKKAALKERYWVPEEDGTYDLERLRRGRPSYISEMETSATKEYPSLIHTFFLTHTVGGVFLNPEDKALYDEMLRLQGLGSNTPTGVPYTEDEIMAIVRGGKQRGHIPGVGWVLPGQEYGGGSESGGCGDDEPGYDKDGEMDLLSFIRTADPTKVRVGKRQHAEGESKLLDTTVGRVVLLLPVDPAQRGDTVSGGHGVDIPQVSATAEIVIEEATLVQPKRQRKRKTVVSDAGEPLHPPKNLREDHETLTGSSIAGKSKSALQRLLDGSVLNPEVGVAALPALPFITSSVSMTPGREDGNQSDFMSGANLRTITAPPKFFISLDSSHYSGANIAEAEVDYFARPSVPLMTMVTIVTSTADPTTTIKERFIEPSIFGGGSSFGTEHTVGGFSGLTGSDFIVADDGRTCREMVDEFAPPKFFALICEMEHDQLFTKFNVGAAHQMSLSAEVRMCVEFNIREKRRLCSVVEEEDSLLKARDEEIKSLKAQLLVKETKATEVIHLCAEASKFEFVEKSIQDEIKSLKERNTALEKEKGVLDVKVADLAATVKVREQEAADSDAMVTTVKLHNDRLVDHVRDLETSSAGLQEIVAVYENYMSQLEKEMFYPHLLTTIVGRRWLLTYGMKLAVFKYLNSPEYLSALGAAISKAIEKGMQDGLAAGITHGQEGRVLADVATFNPSAEDDFTSALQEVQNVNFSLLAELQSNKDESVETVMDLLRLDEALAERALSLFLDVSHGRVQKIRENIANNRLALRDVFVLFSEPLSVVALEGTTGTSSVAPDITTALSVALASASTIPPISMDDYEITHAEDQGNIGVDVDPFLNVDEAELIIS
ncbi:hypothetical protein Tco_0877566 [Tanacetum coccineum]|uniref:Transposase (Putative), gypsy type n=1 Tax=Tanacetum coccineum TaxID=301880 RepID=A0ABQ5BVI4_9ASTR